MAIEMRTVTVPVFTPKPIQAEPVPQNPALAPNGRSNMHNDAYMSDTYTWSGPMGGNLAIGFKPLAGECATLTFDTQGRIITVCSGKNAKGIARTLMMLDPDSLEVLARMDLPSGAGGSTGFGSGGYICLNNKDQVVIPTATQQLWIVDLVDNNGKPGFAVDRWFDLANTIGNSTANIQSAIPDWHGRLWWVTDTGTVGYTDQTSGMSWATQLPAPQGIGNSFAVDETGGVFIASDYCMYRFDVESTGQNPQITWRYSYDRGTREKAGQQNWGTGTTPTLVGRHYCGITDNAEPRMHVIVYNRDKHHPEDRVICRVPVFERNLSDTENSLVGYCPVNTDGGTYFVENNFGYTGTLGQETTPVVPGLARISFDGHPPSGRKIWENNDVVIPSVVSKLSLANGLFYTYTLKMQDGKSAWYITAVEAHTGALAYQVLAGSGTAYDNHYASLFISHAGVVYVPTMLGIVVLRNA